MADRVTIGVPAYEAAAFLEETLDSALSQSWKEIDVVISIDKGRDDTGRVAARFGHLANVRIVEQPQRLGWIGNSNFVLRQGATRHVMILPHDDILAPDYVAACLDGLRAHPAAVIAYCDLAVIGRPADGAVQRSIRGSHHDRLKDVFENHFNAVAYRGVLDRSKALRHAIPRSIASYAADTLWFAKLACQGNLIRVPGVRYHKRLLASSAHAAWSRASPEERHEMWAVHCVELMHVVLEASPPFQWTPELDAAWLRRLVHSPVLLRAVNPVYADSSKSPAEHAAEIFARVAARAVPYSWVRA